MFLGLDVKLPAGVFTNDDGKQFSTGMHKKKILGKVIAIFQKLLYSNFNIVLLIMAAHNLSIQIEGLYKFVSVTKGEIFVSY